MGSVSKRDNGWKARWDEPGPKGTRRQKSKAGFKTKKAAELFLAGKVTTLGQGQVGSDMTLAEFGPIWLQGIKHEMSETTWRAYEIYLRVWILPTLGKRRLADVAPGELQALYGRVVEQGRSPRTARYVHTTARRLYKDAIRWEQATRNPTDGARPPTQVRKLIRAWSAAETATFLESVQDDRWEAMWWFMVDSAVRRSELVAMTWPQLEGNLATVWKGKTKASRRTIALTEQTVSKMEAWRATQDQERLFCGDAWLGDDRIFTWEDGEAIIGPWLSYTFKSLVERAGLPLITPHELRHSWATQALKSGVPLAVVSERLGHSSIAITADFYTAVPQQVDHEAAMIVSSQWVPTAN